MGPSGSGKSTLMHCLAGLDTLTVGPGVHRRRRPRPRCTTSELTLLRRDRIGFVFQAFNLVPTLTARENITLPDGPRRPQARPGVARPGGRHRRPRRPARRTARASCPAASSSGSPWPGRWPAGPRSSSPTSPPATSTRRTGAEILAFMRRAVDELGQTIVMVTHDPVAAAYADRVVFLADGRIVDEMADPTADRVLDRMKRLRELTPCCASPSRPSPPTSGACSPPASAVLLGVAFLAGTLVLADTHDRRLRRPRSPRPTRAPTPSSAASVEVGEGDVAERGLVDALAGRRPSPRSTASPPPSPASRASPSSSAPTATRSAATARPPSPATGSTTPELNPFDLAEGRAPDGAGRGRHRPGSRRGRRPGGRRHDHGAHARPGRGDDRRHRHLRRRRQPGRRPPSPASPPSAEQVLMPEPGQVVEHRGARPTPGVSQDELVRPRSTPVLPDGVEALTGAELTAERQSEHRGATSSSFFEHVPARVRRRRPARRHVQHLQHLLDPRRPAHPRVGAAAGPRRLAAPGAAARSPPRRWSSACSPRRSASPPASAWPSGLLALMDAIGLDLPAAPLVLDAGTVVDRRSPSAWSSRWSPSLAPAVRASRVAPLAALRDVAVDRSGDLAAAGRRRRRRRRRRASPLTVVGATGDGAAARPGLGALADPRRRRRPRPGRRPARRRPCSAPRWRRWRGMSGALARRNAMRNPRRTAGTAVGADGRRRRGDAVHRLRRVAQAVDRRRGRRAVRRRPGDRRRRLQRRRAQPDLAPAVAELPEVDGGRRPRATAPCGSTATSTLAATVDPATHRVGRSTSTCAQGSLRRPRRRPGRRLGRLRRGARAGARRPGDRSTSPTARPSGRPSAAIYARGRPERGDVIMLPRDA